MKKYILFFAITLTCFSFDLKAQQEVTKNGTPENQKFGFYAGYYGYKYTNPGMQVGFENYIATTKNFQIIGSLTLQFHHKNKSQTAFALNARIGQRYTTNFGLCLETFLGIGVQNTFYVSTIYDMTTNPVKEETKIVNKTGAIPNIALGIGYDFSRKTNVPLTFYLRQNITWLLPDINLVFATSPSFEAGFIYKLKKK